MKRLRSAVQSVAVRAPASGDRPLGDEISYGRKDNTIYRRGISGGMA